MMKGSEEMHVKSSLVYPGRFRANIAFVLSSNRASRICPLVACFHEDLFLYSDHKLTIGRHGSRGRGVYYTDLWCTFCGIFV